MYTRYFSSPIPLATMELLLMNPRAIYSYTSEISIITKNQNATALNHLMASVKNQSFLSYGIPYPLYHTYYLPSLLTQKK